jgi:CheY-like chemotaxis protein
MRDSEPTRFLDRLRRWRSAPPAPVAAVADQLIALPSALIVTPAETLDSPAPAREELRAGSRRVLLVGDDRRFRALASTLLSQRGYSVSVGHCGEDVVKLAVREGVDVVVIDASASLTAAAHEAARLGCLTPPIGIVAVSADCHAGLATLPVVAKWSPFEALFGAIERACADISRDEVTSGTV